MSLPSGITVTLGSFTFPMAPQVIQVDDNRYFVEHDIPGMLNSNMMDYMGGKQRTIALRGVFVSGADANIRDLLSSGMLMSSQAFSVTSAFSGLYFVSATVSIMNITLNYNGGRSFPHYTYSIALQSFRPGSERVLPESFAGINEPPLSIIESGADGESVHSGLPGPVIPPYEDATIKVGAPELNDPSIERSGGTP